MREFSQEEFPRPPVAARPFVIFALPRSRTAWLAHWLHGPSHLVGHDIAIECDTPDDFMGSYRNGMRGTVETGAVVYWKQIVQREPRMKVMTIRRSRMDVARSFAPWGIRADEELLVRDRALDDVERVLGCPSFLYDDLRQLEALGWIWNYLLPEWPFDPEYTINLSSVNIQVDMPARMAQLVRRAKAIEKLIASLQNGVH